MMTIPCLRAIVGALALLWLAACSSSSKPVDFAPRHPDRIKIRESFKEDADIAAKYKPSASAQKVIEHFMAANRMTAMRAKYSPMEMEMALTNMRMAANHLLMEEGHKSGRALGLYMLEKFEKKLAAISKASGKVPGAAVALLTGAEPPPAIVEEFEDFAAYGGSFLVLAAANDLARQGKNNTIKLSTQDRFFIRLAYKVYWSNVMPDGTHALDWMLTKFERNWYNIWVAERSLTAPPRRKLKAINELRASMKDYPVGKARGLIYYKARRYPKAAQEFEKALRDNPKDRELKYFLSEAKKKVR